MPKFNKMKGFSLKSGNKPTFQQMGGVSPGKMYDTPGKMYNAPLKAETKKEEETTEDVDKKEPVKPKDKLGVKIAKIAANAAIGGFDAVTGHKTARPTINFGHGKAEEEAKALDPGQKAIELSAKEQTQKSRDAINKDLTGTFAEFTSDGKVITPDDPKQRKNLFKDDR